MKFIGSTEIKELSPTGVISRQLLDSDNSESKRVTILPYMAERCFSTPLFDKLKGRV